jgi:hypothetical protein
MGVRTRLGISMRKLLAGAAFGAMMAVAGQAMALGPNILVNGGFETGDFTGWTVSGNRASRSFPAPGSTDSIRRPATFSRPWAPLDQMVF